MIRVPANKLAISNGIQMNIRLNGGIYQKHGKYSVLVNESLECR